MEGRAFLKPSYGNHMKEDVLLQYVEVSAHKIELKLMSGNFLDNNLNVANVSYQWIRGTKQALGEFKSPDMHSRC